MRAKTTSRSSLFTQRPSTEREKTQLQPIIAVSFDPGSRHLGYSIIKTKDDVPITMANLASSSTYTVLACGLIDAKSIPEQLAQIDLTDPTTPEKFSLRHSHLKQKRAGSKAGSHNPKASLSEISTNLWYYLVGNAKSPFVKALLPLLTKYKDTHTWYFYSENQEGVGAFDRKRNPFLVDALGEQNYVNGAISSIGRHYGIHHVRHPGKTVKWGNSSVPQLPARFNATDTELGRIKDYNKTLRKDFFIHFVMRLVSSGPIYQQLSSMNMEDRAHICDSISQGMRAIMTDAWLELEDLQNDGVLRATTSLPSPLLDKDELNHVLDALTLNTRTSFIMALIPADTILKHKAESGKKAFTASYKDMTSSSTETASRTKPTTTTIVDTVVKPLSKKRSRSTEEDVIPKSKKRKISNKVVSKKS